MKHGSGPAAGPKGMGSSLAHFSLVLLLLVVTPPWAAATSPATADPEEFGLLQWEGDVEHAAEHGRGLLFRGMGLARMGRTSGLSGAGLRQRRPTLLGPRHPVANSVPLAKRPLVSNASRKPAPLPGRAATASQRATSQGPNQPGRNVSPAQRLVPWLAGAHMWRRQEAIKERREEEETARRRNHPSVVQANIDPATGEDRRDHLHRFSDGIRDKVVGFKPDGSTARRLLRQ